MKYLWIGALAAVALFGSARAQNLTPRAATTVTVATGGTAVSVFTGPMNGCAILNPLSATDQGVVSAEVATIDIVGAASATGNGTTFTLQPGQAWYCPPTNATVSVNAATSGHKISAVRW